MKYISLSQVVFTPGVSVTCPLMVLMNQTSDEVDPGVTERAVAVVE